MSRWCNPLCQQMPFNTATSRTKFYSGVVGGNVFADALVHTREAIIAVLSIGVNEAGTVWERFWSVQCTECVRLFSNSNIWLTE